MSEAPKLDEQGNPIVKETETPERNEELVSAKKQIEELQVELGKLKNKEFNFKRLRDMTEDEKSKLSALEQDLVSRQEKLEEQQTSFHQRVVEQNKNDVFAVLAGNDDGLRKQIEFHYNRLPEEAVTKEEVAKKAKDAFLLANSGRSDTASSDQLSRVMGTNASVPTRQTVGVTEDQAQLAKALGITDEELKKLK